MGWLKIFKIKHKKDSERKEQQQRWILCLSPCAGETSFALGKPRPMKGSSWELETTRAISSRSKKPTRYQRPGVGVQGNGGGTVALGFPWDLCGEWAQRQEVRYWESGGCSHLPLGASFAVGPLPAPRTGSKERLPGCPLLPVNLSPPLFCFIRLFFSSWF